MAKTTIQLQVQSQEVWGFDGKVTEHIRLGMSSDNGGDSPGMYEANHSVSLCFAEGEGFKNFPMGEMVDVTFEPVKGGG